MGGIGGVAGRSERRLGGGLWWLVLGGVVWGGLFIVRASIGLCCSVIAMRGGGGGVVACLLSRHEGMTYGIDTSMESPVSLDMSELADTKQGSKS